MFSLDFLIWIYKFIKEEIQINIGLNFEYFIYMYLYTGILKKINTSIHIYINYSLNVVRLSSPSEMEWQFLSLSVPF